jgi:hypothetical protein
MRRRQTWIGVLVIIAVLLLIDTVPGHADHGGYGYTGHAYRSHGHRGFHRSGGCVCSLVLGSWCRLGPTGGPILTHPS